MSDEHSVSHDADWIVVGSGFGGSVSSLRLAEKGYRVKVLECGKRYRDSTLPKSFWNTPKIFWAPFVKAFGLIRLSNFKHLTVLSGSSVGGGSHAYAATLYRARDEFYEHPQWRGIADWKSELAPHYDTASKMLGVSKIPFDQPIDDLIRDMADMIGCPDSYSKASAGIFFGDESTPQGTTVPDPYFGGAGPERTSCIRCGACMQGCPFGAKNTLLKNYLWFAEKLGVTIHEKTTVENITPLGAADGSDGYRVDTLRTGAWLLRQRRSFTARGVVISSGAVGTNRLLGSLKLRGSLPGLSSMINKVVRSNSETLLAVDMPFFGDKDYSEGVPIPASIYPTDKSHIEMATAGRWGSAFYALNTVMTPPAEKPLLFLRTVLRHPWWLLKSLWPFGGNRRSVIVARMQNFDEALSFEVKNGRFGRFTMDTAVEPGRDFPSGFPDFKQQVLDLAAKYGAVPQATVFESLLNKPVTAHLLGGAVIGRDDSSGVIDAQHRVYNYHNLLVCDGAAVPANPGVNPSLTITALAERAMSFIPAKKQASEETPRTTDSARTAATLAGETA